MELSRERLTRELPLLLGVLLALGFLLHPGFDRFGFPEGSDWDSYLASAAHLLLDAKQFAYNPWRQPLYPLLVGGLGSALGAWALAGQLVALLSCLAMVVAAGLLGRALHGPWVGGLAALSTCLNPVLVDASFWVNPYPVVGACCGLAVALAACCARWPRVGLAVGVSVLAGAAWAFDPRTLLISLALPILVALAPARSSRRALLAGLVVAGLGLGWGANKALVGHYELELRSVQSQLSEQHDFAGRPGHTGAHQLPLTGQLDACGVAERGPIGPGTLVGRCAQQLRRKNLGELWDRGYLPPGLLSLAFLLSLVSPWPRGRRGVVASVLVFGPPVVALLSGVSLVQYADRYLLPFATCLGVLAPLALARLAAVAARVGAPRRWARGVSAVVAVLCVVAVWPGVALEDLRAPQRIPGRPVRDVPLDQDVRLVILAVLDESMASEDLLLDCSDQWIAQALLPRRIQVRAEPPHGPQCERWVRRPPAVSGIPWLLVATPPHGRKARSRITPDLLLASGWERVPLPVEPDPGSHAERMVEHLHLWRQPVRP